MADIIEEVEIPPHNKDCEHCLRTQLKVKAFNKGVQTLAGTDHLLHTANKDMLQAINEHDKRISALEKSLEAAKVAAEVSKMWWNVVTAFGGAILLGLLWWISNVQKHVETFGGKQ